jgi:NAD-dependent deacetylase sirtuin 4
VYYAFFNVKSTNYVSEVQAEHDQVPVRRPDGDVELVDAGEKFSVPACPVCRGVLKPAVVFFGGSVVPSIAARAAMLAENCHSALIVGTSLSTLSVYKHVLNMAEQGKPLAAINVGDTRADGLLDFKVAARAGETLMRLASHPKMLLPRPVS